MGGSCAGRSCEGRTPRAARLSIAMTRQAVRVRSSRPAAWLWADMTRTGQALRTGSKRRAEASRHARVMAHRAGDRAHQSSRNAAQVVTVQASCRHCALEFVLRFLTAHHGVRDSAQIAHVCNSTRHIPCAPCQEQPPRFPLSDPTFELSTDVLTFRYSHRARNHLCAGTDITCAMSADLHL